MEQDSGIDRSPSADEPAIVEMEEVGVEFGNVQALDGINLSIHRGEIVALLGDNGAGKSTIAGAVAGMCSFQYGRIILNGTPFTTLNPALVKEYGIEMIQQEIRQADNLTVAKYFFLGREQLVSRFIPLLASKSMNRRVQEYFDTLELDLGKRPGDRLSTLTKGQRQILDVAIAYYFHSSLIIMDEATNSLSKHEYERVMSLMKKVRERGGAVLVIDHKVQDVFDYADRFLVLYGGRNLVKMKKEATSPREIEKILISSHLSTVKEMAAGITHQIRNPLAIMKVSAQMVREDFRVEQRQEAFHRKVEDVLRDIDMLDLFVHSFFDFTHDHKPYYRNCKVSEVIEEAVSKIPLHVVGERVIEEETPKAGVEYRMIRSNVVQILINLLLLIIENSDPHSYIRIAVSIRRKLTIEFFYLGSEIPDELENGHYSPLFFRKRSPTGLGATIFHHMFHKQHCSIELGARSGQDSSEKYLRLVL